MSMARVVITGDCIDTLRAMPDASVHAVVTDPPYGLSQHTAADTAECLRAWVEGREYRHGKGGFMGRAWDSWVPGPDVWREVLRVLKPGGHACVFAGTRTVDLMGIALRLAGFEIRDSLHWITGTGFPKSWNFGTSFKGDWCACPDGGNPLPSNHDKAKPEYGMRPVRQADLPAPINACGERGQVLLKGLQEQGTPTEGAVPEPGALGVGKPCMGRGLLHRAGQGVQDGALSARVREHGAGERIRPGAPAGDGEVDGSAAARRGGGAPHRPQQDQQRPEQPSVVREPQGALGFGAPGGRAVCEECGGLRRHWQGVGTALKPSHEPIILARKPLDGTVAANVLAHGAGGLNVDGCRVGAGDAVPGGGSGSLKAGGFGSWHDSAPVDSGPIAPHTAGRWPPNIILTHTPGCTGDRNGAGCVDGCAVGEMGAQSGVLTSGLMRAGTIPQGVRGTFGNDARGGYSTRGDTFGDTGTAARFFPSFRYCAKASRSEREAGLVPPEHGKRANRHPTVKPIALMRWLVRLVTPPGGVVLDPFTGSGTTGCAAALESFGFIGCEMDEGHADLARRRIAHWAGEPLVDDVQADAPGKVEPEQVAQLSLL
jgi:DNA modification methylase